MIIAFRHNDKMIPMLKVIDRPQQVIVALIPMDGEHFTIHPQGEGFLITHWDKHRTPTSHDNMIVEAASAAGYKDPEKHTKYVRHSDALKISGIKGYHIIGRAIDLSKCETYSKYSQPNIIWDVPATNLMYDFYLSTSDQRRDCSKEYYYETSVGMICVTTDQPPNPLDWMA